MFLVKVRQEMRGTTRHTWFFPVLLVAVIVLILGITVSESWAIDNLMIDTEFDEAVIFFEENTTDGDLGIQIFFDGEPWDFVWVISPENRVVFSVNNGGSLSEIGSTEVFTESAEPSFNEIPREELIGMFPEGEYTFIGTTVEGETIAGTSMLSHNLAAPVSLEIDLNINNNSAVIEWVDESAVNDPEIIGYEVVTEMVVEDESGEERVFVNTATFPASVMSFTVSPEFVSLALDYQAAGTLLEAKVEVIAIEESGNKTITEEVVFETGE